MTKEQGDGIKRYKNDNGDPVVEIKSPRYKLPIALPEGIYNMVARMAKNSVLSAEERHKANETARIRLENAIAEDAKLTPEERKKRDKDYQARKKKESDKRLEEAKKAIEEMRKKGFTV